MNIKERNKGFNEYFNSAACKKKAFEISILSVNSKLSKSNNGKVIYTGIEMPSAFKGSCKPTKWCPENCILASGMLNMFKNKEPDSFVTSSDKVKLARFYLYKKESKFFYTKLNSEIDIEIMKAEIENKTVFIRPNVFTELYDLYKYISLSYPSIIVNDYFKVKARIYEDYASNELNIYSWNDTSTEKELIACAANSLPIATVIPKKLFNSIFGLKDKAKKIIRFKGLALVNGDLSDLACFDYIEEGTTVISLLSRKVTRRATKTNPFLESYSKLFNLIEYQKGGI